MVTTGGSSGGWASIIANWVKDNPEATAALIGVAGGAVNNATAPKGNLQFKEVPESAYERALRLHAERLAGVPGADGKTPAGALPTYGYLGPQVDAALQNRTNAIDSYQPLQRMDMSGNMVARPSQPTPVKVDRSTLPTPWSSLTREDYERFTSGQAGGTSTALDPKYAPPPPPNVYRSSKGERVNDLVDGAAKGALGGIGGGAVGMLAGAFGGVFSGRNKYKEHEKKSKAAYKAWQEQYASAFTNSAGAVIPPPKNRKEYDAWYKERYGILPPDAKKG